MLSNVDIRAYKCIEAESLDLAPLTLMTGTNSSGKSTLLQAILVAMSYLKQNNLPYLRDLVKPYMQLEDVLCRTTDARKVEVVLTTTEHSVFSAYIAETGGGL